MSHFKQRHQTNCLNCGMEVHGLYCHHCGQENIEPKESFWHLVTHFFYDITHFDGKFFSTVKYLLTRPGFLSKEYLKGRRTTYLNPIRMYVFISAFFFLFLFSVTNPHLDVNAGKDANESAAKVKQDLKEQRARLSKSLKDSSDLKPAKLERAKRRMLILDSDIVLLNADTNNVNRLKSLKDDSTILIDTYESRKQYDSAQNALSTNKKDGWFKRRSIYKTIDLKAEFANSNRTFFEKLVEKFIHSFPKLLFVSLPLFALILRLLYVRRRQFYYVDHVIYSVHLYCATFLQLLLILMISKVAGLHHLAWVNYLFYPLGIYMLWYFFRSIHKFYGQNIVKTSFKILLLLLLSFVIMTLLIGLSLVLNIFFF